MYKGSVREYEILKNDTETIKKSILQFIGFIISIAGIAAAFANIDFKENRPILVMGAIAAGIIAITLLFEIIWYKFKSHNRYVGYTRLLTQEISCVNLTEDIKNKKCGDGESHLDNIFVTNDITEKHLDLFTWEFMMARMNNADFDDSELKIYNTIKTIRFKFQIPESEKYKNIEKTIRGNLEANYFRNVVKPLYKPKKNIYQIFWDKLCDGLRGLIDLYLPVRSSLFKLIFQRVNQNYLSTGWLFPKKVIQVIFFPICLLLTFFFSFVATNYEPSIHQISYSATFMFYIVICIGLIWIFRYVGGLRAMLYGKYSTEYFSWFFFIYRIQLLNSYKIFPIYFSQNFVKYFRTIKILNLFERLYDKTNTTENKNCPICKQEKNDILELISNTQFNINSDLTQFTFICVDCHKLYCDKLMEASKVPTELIILHRKLEELVNPK